MSVLAPWIVPEGWALVALETALDAADLYAAARDYEAGDLAAVGEYVLVTALDHFVDSVAKP